MLALSTLRDVPDELANRMMVAHGSRALLRALNGEPEVDEMAEPIKLKQRKSTGYVAVSKRPPLAIPRVIQSILESVGEAFEVHPDELRGKGKAQLLVLARSVAIRLIRDRVWETGEPKHSTPTIGRYLGRDHSTICHALEHFDDYARRFPEIAEVYETLRETVE